MIEIRQKCQPAVTSQQLSSNQYNRIAPAYERGTLKTIGLRQEFVPVSPAPAMAMPGPAVTRAAEPQPFRPVPEPVYAAPPRTIDRMRLPAL